MFSHHQAFINKCFNLLLRTLNASEHSIHHDTCQLTKTSPEHQLMFEFNTEFLFA